MRKSGLFGRGYRSGRLAFVRQISLNLSSSNMQQTSCLDFGARPLPAPTPPGVLTGVPPPPRRANDLDLGAIQSKISNL